LSEILTLGQLLLILRQNGVSKFKDQTFEIEFGPRASLEDPMVNLVPQAADKVQDSTQIDEDLLFHSAG
jgi:hypothetical protein